MNNKYILKLYCLVLLLSGTGMQILAQKQKIISASPEASALTIYLLLISLQLFNQLTRLDYLIRSKSKGTPIQVAERLDMSQRNLYYVIGIMKMLRAPIEFCRTRQTYVYNEGGQFIIGFIKNHQK